MAIPMSSQIRARNGNGTAATVAGTLELRPRDPVERAVLVAIESALGRFRENEDAAGRGTVEGIHRFRTATRRLRSELRAFRELVDADWIGPLEAELKWLAGLLGAVRDLDVLSARFRKAAGPEDGPRADALAPLFADLSERHDRAACDLREALRGDRYRGLLDALRRALNEPPPGGDTGTPCREAMPPLAASAWRRLKKSARALDPDDPDEAFHQVRKRAKRARYTAEMVAPVLSGSSARGGRRFIKGATRVQDVLGEHQDAIVAGQELGKLLDRRAGGPEFERAARRLLDDETEAARDARERFFDVWDRLDRKKARRWMKAGAH